METPKLTNSINDALTLTTQTLYRAVGPDELADIEAIGAFRPSPFGLEGKYFTTTPEGAISYADQAVRGFGDPLYTLVETSMPTSLIRPKLGATVDRGIPSVVVPNDRLNQLSAPVVVGPIPPPTS